MNEDLCIFIYSAEIMFYSSSEFQSRIFQSHSLQISSNSTLSYLISLVFKKTFENSFINVCRNEKLWFF